MVCLSQRLFFSSFCSSLFLASSFFPPKIRCAFFSPPTKHCSLVSLLNSTDHILPIFFRPQFPFVPDNPPLSPKPLRGVPGHCLLSRHAPLSASIPISFGFDTACRTREKCSACFARRGGVEFGTHLFAPACSRVGIFSRSASVVRSHSSPPSPLPIQMFAPPPADQ